MEYAWSVLALLVGGGAGFFAERAIRGTAFKTRDEILLQAKRDGENLLKTAELQAKEEGLRRRESARPTVSFVASPTRICKVKKF